MTTTYAPPIDPADPEAAALDLIVEAAEAATGSTAFRPVLQDLAGLLQVEGALAGLAWPDARLVAAAISFGACTQDDPAAALRERAAAASASRDEVAWCDRAAAVRAFGIAAAVLDS